MPENNMMIVSPEVEQAITKQQAVVALETTVVTHGLPRPDGIDAAIQIDEVVRQAGAVPAAIAVLDGTIRIGLQRAELRYLAEAPDTAKVNPGNLAALLAARRSGSTTVAATALLARRAGIGVLATGGIGGVHRDYSETLDTSADLTTLGRIPIAVVCAGAKAVLDLPRTVRALETLGVPILGYRTEHFPAFYRRESGLRADARIDSMATLAMAVRTHFQIAGTGLLVVTPVPRDAEMPLELYESAVERAVEDAGKSGVRGRDATPYLLERLRELTGGASVKANRALLAENARVAAELAKALLELDRSADVTAARYDTL
jgi:pseudouridylate synthase